MNEFETLCLVCDNSDLLPNGEKDGHPIVSCAECDLCFVDPMPSDEQLSAIYDDYNETGKYLVKKRKKVLTAWHKIWLAQRHLKAPRKRFLDIGCNIGAVAEAARRMGYEAHGIDLGESTVQTANGLFPDCHFKAQSSFDLAAQGEQFDLVFCLEVLEHVPEPRKFMASVRGLLRDGGILYMTTPDAGHFRVPNVFTDWDEVFPPEHLAWYRRSNLTRLFADAGFEIIRFRACQRANLRAIARAVSQ